MDLKEIKRLTTYARRAGLKSLKVDGLEFEFQDAVIFPARGSKPKLVPVDEPLLPKSPPLPTLDEINSYIYSTDEVG